jgi:hypothetical protein
MAELNNTSNAKAPKFEYKCLVWGDLIYGTKEQLQSLGLGVDIPFPSGRKKLMVTDPRGFPAEIQESGYKGDGIFSASIHFPERDFPKEEWLPFKFGVTRHDGCWADEFKGSAEALAAAGLIQINQLPGQPGMRKGIVRIHSDGTISSSNKKTSSGDKTIQRASKSRYILHVYISNEEAERRRCADVCESKAWERRMAALPRPAPLHSSGLKLNTKDDDFSSPALFKDSAIHLLNIGIAMAMSNLSGKSEFSEYGETTIWLDEQSMNDVLSAGERLKEAIRTAKVVCRKKESHLSVVKL